MLEQSDPVLELLADGLGLPILSAFLSSFDEKGSRVEPVDDPFGFEKVQRKTGSYRASEKKINRKAAVVSFRTG